VEHKGLLHANDVLLALVTLGLDDPALSCGLPVSSFGGPIRPAPVGVLAVLGREEEPLGIIRPDQRFICTYTITSAVFRITQRESSSFAGEFVLHAGKQSESSPSSRILFSWHRTKSNRISEKGGRGD